LEKFILELNQRKCTILVGEDSLKYLKEILMYRRCFFIIDKIVYEKFYSTYLKELISDLNHDIYLFECVERNKDINIVIEIIRILSQNGYIRDSVLIGIGGGIVGDIAGFVSSIYMRGIKFINIPTTLLAQVDSSIGGKNAINVSGCKNLVGTFNQPHFIVIDNNFLKGLSRREIISGLAEALKYGIVCEYDFLTYIYIYLMDILRGEIEVIREIVKRSCKIKINIIKRDEYDTSIRKILNHGHTVGHAIESVTNYSVYTHGEAVIIGMYYESLIAFKLNLIDETYFAYIDKILKSFGIKFDNNVLNEDRFYEALLMDKKNKFSKISFILPISPSKVEEYMFSVNEIKEFNFSKYHF
jgi:3-dehydroquinate synthetase